MRRILPRSVGVAVLVKKLCRRHVWIIPPRPNRIFVNMLMRFIPTLLCIAVLMTEAGLRAADLPDYAPAPADNPLKGFVPYAGQARDFPHSLEFGYFSLRAIMTGPHEFDWQPIERLLSDAKSRGCQTVFRIYLEYPNKPAALPQFLLDAGVKIHTNTIRNGSKPETMLTPDYEDARLREALAHFIAALGARYDGDPRVGYITAGLLGKWGEWHDHPVKQLWASKAVQREIMDAYSAAFKKTPVLLRYPAGENDPAYASNHDRPFGYHDDSFAWATLPSDKRDQHWFFLAQMSKAGADAMLKWTRYPIGGEVRPELWRNLWDEPSGAPPGQEFIHCVEQTHATWLMDSSIARHLNDDQRKRALLGAQRLGYEFYMVGAQLRTDDSKGELRIVATLRNVGVAPFYADWPVELGMLNAQGEVVAAFKPGWTLSGLLPSDADRRLEHAADIHSLARGEYRLLMRVPNPMPEGRPLRFANRAQDQHLSGWLTLGNFAQR